MLGIRTVVSSALGLDIRDRGMVSIACLWVVPAFPTNSGFCRRA